MTFAMRTPMVSVIVATYNRADAVARLLSNLAEQTLPAEQFEVIVVDDGSKEPAEARLRGLATPFRLEVVTQANAGPAAARHRAITRASGELLVIVDDDMRVRPDFLAAHVAAHPKGTRHVALGPVRTDRDARLPLFERFHTNIIERVLSDAREGRVALRGSHVYTGNVSMRRADYLAAGGFDHSLRISEDAELGLRLEQSGATVVLCDEAVAMHESDHASLAGWMRRSEAYGGADARISEKHPSLLEADPWRFLLLVNAVSRPWLLAAALWPRVMRPMAGAAMRVAQLCDRLGMERLALAGVTFVYGLLYYIGVRGHAGSRAAAMAGLGRCLNRTRDEGLGFAMRFAKMVADVRADHAAIARADAKYSTSVVRRPRLLADAVQRIGFQMMIAYRVMRFLRGGPLPFLAKIASRMIRHLYGADLHWDAELAPGVMIVHGAGLIVSHAARVGPGGILFQHVTLGESIHPVTREIGAPRLERDVHVGPGATLLGPIELGAGTKVMAGAVLTESTPPQSLVEVPAPTIRVRGASRATRPDTSAQPYARMEIAR